MSFFKFTRSECCVCGGSELSGSVVTRPIPIFQGCVNQQPELTISERQTWVGCDTCGCVQLLHVPDPNLVYQAAHAESAGRLWLEHHGAFAKIVEDFAASRVVEIGGGTGLLAEQARKLGVSAHWTNVEPNPIQRPDLEGYSAFTGFFETVEPSLFEGATIVFSHCLEHVQDLKATLKHLTTVQAAGDRVIVSWPQIEDWLGYRKPGALNWEHTFFISIDHLINAFSQHGYTMLHRAEWRNHSVFLCFERIEKQDLIPWQSTKDYLPLVDLYFSRFQNTGKELNKLVKNHLGDGVFLCPASVYSQYLVAHMSRSLELSGVLDNSKEKQGRTLYETGLTVYPPESLRSMTNPLVILCAGDHATQLKRQISAICPSVEIHVVE